MRLTPRFGRFAVPVLAFLAITTLGEYYFQGEVEHKWWSATYVLSLACPFAVFIAVAWFGTVPRRLEVTDRELSIQFWTLPPARHDWQGLEAWRIFGSTVWMGFSTGNSATVPLTPFPGEQGAFLKDFLARRFPEREIDHREYFAWRQAEQRRNGRKHQVPKLLAFAILAVAVAGGIAVLALGLRHKL